MIQDTKNKIHALKMSGEKFLEAFREKKNFFERNQKYFENFENGKSEGGREKFEKQIGNSIS